MVTATIDGEERELQWMADPHYQYMFSLNSGDDAYAYIATTLKLTPDGVPMISYTATIRPYPMVGTAFSDPFTELESALLWVYAKLGVTSKGEKPC